MKNLKNQITLDELLDDWIENGIESVKSKARVYDIGYIEAYRMWIKGTVAGPAVRAAVMDAFKPLDNYYTSATYNTEDIY